MRGFAVFCLAIFALSSVVLADSKKDWADCAANDPERSLAGCNKIIARGKDTKANLAIAHYNRGNDYQAEGEHDKAIADYNKSIDLKPQASTYHNRGYSYSRQGLYDKAIADYDQALKLEPKHKFAYYNRGVAFGKKGDHVQAVMDYNRAAEFTPDDHGLFNDRGHSYAQLGDLDKALADFEKSISLKSDYALAHSNRAWVLERKEKHQEAVAAYSEALRHGQANADDLNSRAFSEIKIGQYSAAIADLNEALRLNPEHLFAHQNRGWAYWLNGDLDHAIADYDEALRKSPDKIDLLVDHAGLLDDRGEYARAIVDYDKVLAIESDHAVALNGRAWAYSQTGNLDKALVDSERAVALNPTEPNTRHTRAWIYTKKGMLDLAMSDYDKVLGIDPELAGAYADRGHTFELKGNRQKAIADYRKALSLQSKQVYDDRAKAEALTRLTKLAAVTPGRGEVAPQPQPRPLAQAKKPEKRIALVIGNRDYVNVRALKNAGRDASAMAGAFRRLGFEVLERHDLTFAELVSELKDFGDKTPSYDWAVVYYAGHGIEIGGINYLIPVDAKLAYATHVDDEALPLAQVLAKVEGAKKLKLVILDACRENPFIAKMASAGTTRSVGRGLARIEPSGGVLVAYSAKDGQVAQDGDGNNSPYAEALLGLLDQPGLEINMLFRRVRDEVKSTTGGQQEPFTYGSLPAEPFFFKSAAQ